MTTKCEACKVWDSRKGGWLYHKIIKTSFRPPPGIEPELREYVCEDCKRGVYIKISRKDIEEEKYGKL